MLSHISQLTYAVGDIHGHDDLFGRMIERIRADAEALGERLRLVLLGDYIDRGRGSAEVLDRILALETATWCDLVAIKGNHEDALLRFLDEPEFGEVWQEWGGAATLSSYGIAISYMHNTPQTWVAVRDAFARLIDPDHVALLRRMPPFFQVDDYLFVHGGVDPSVPLSEQDESTFMFIRSKFLRAEKACDFVVVHGHTPEDEPDNLPWRIGVDTGIYYNGRLTAVRLRGTERSFLQVEGDLEIGVR